MPRFDPVALMDACGIEYTISRGNAYCRCPDCGDSDHKGDNFGIRLDGSTWGCWRDRSHSGPLNLVIRKLTGWGTQQVIAYLGESTPTSPIEELILKAKNLGHKVPAPAQEEVVLLPEFRIPKPGGLAGRFVRYLEGRGFEDVPKLVSRYTLRCATSGRFHDRIILPIYDGGTLRGWTARAIGAAKLRYLAHPPGNSIKDYLFNAPISKAGGKVLVVVEGPFDALKLDYYGYRLGLHAVALMGTYATPSQISLIANASREFTLTTIVLDAAARAQALRLRASLAGTRCRIASPLGPNVKDPGELTPDAAREVIGGLLTF